MCSNSRIVSFTANRPIRSRCANLAFEGHIRHSRAYHPTAAPCEEFFRRRELITPSPVDEAPRLRADEYIQKRLVHLLQENPDALAPSGTVVCCDD